MIKPLQKYRNITTGREVEVEKVYDSQIWAQSVVAYIRIHDFKGFMKPVYVFERTYKLINTKKL